MRNKARDYSETTLKKLYLLSCNECAFPGCAQKLAREDRDDFTVNICHIEAANEGGARYNKDSNDEYRKGYDNLILLCVLHHIETNDEGQYSVDTLRKMKRDHHLLMAQRTSMEEILDRYPSALIEIINIIGSSDIFDDADSLSSLEEYKVSDKIKFHSVIRYQPIIKEYAPYQGRLNVIYAEIEKQGSYKKHLLLQSIKNLYLLAKGKLLGREPSIENIRAKADDLIEDVQNEMWKIVERKTNGLTANIHYEAIHVSLLIVLVDAFLRCKILEEPEKDDSQ
jgi:hypothetical protein